MTALYVPEPGLVGSRARGSGVQLGLTHLTPKSREVLTQTRLVIRREPQIGGTKAAGKNLRLVCGRRQAPQHEAHRDIIWNGLGISRTVDQNDARPPTAVGRQVP